METVLVLVFFLTPIFFAAVAFALSSAQIQNAVVASRHAAVRYSLVKPRRYEHRIAALRPRNYTDAQIENEARKYIAYYPEAKSRVVTGKKVIGGPGTSISFSPLGTVSVRTTVNSTIPSLDYARMRKEQASQNVSVKMNWDFKMWQRCPRHYDNMKGVVHTFAQAKWAAAKAGLQGASAQAVGEALANRVRAPNPDWSLATDRLLDFIPWEQFFAQRIAARDMQENCPGAMSDE